LAEKQLAKAIALVKQGNKADAVQIVKSVLQQESKNVKAWWMMANLLEKPEQKEKAAHRVLSLKPDHEGAKKLLASLNVSSISDNTPVQEMNYDWSKLQKNPANTKRESSSEESTGIGTRIAIGFTALIAIIGVFILLTLIYSSINSLEARLERITRQFVESNMSLDLERANNYLCGEQQYSDQLVEDASRFLSELGDYELSINFSDLSINILSQNENTIRARLSGEAIGRLILSGETREETIALEDYLRPDIGRPAGTLDFVRENGRWRICSEVRPLGF